MCDKKAVKLMQQAETDRIGPFGWADANEGDDKKDF